MQDLLNQITPVLTTTLIAIIVAIVGYLGKEVVKLVPLLIDNIVAKIGLAKYQQDKMFAQDIWHIVDEHFRVEQIVGDTIQAKITLFRSLIKRKIPAITDLQIENLRQAIAGEVNKNKALIIKNINEPNSEISIDK